jgi:hypothetical protein
MATITIKEQHEISSHIEEAKQEKVETNEQEIHDEELGDIQQILKEYSYQFRTYPNGLTTGIRFKGIPGTRGVLVEILHVIDLRVASFGGTNLARKSAILARTNRSTDSILTDFKMQDRYVEKRVWTIQGRITMKMLRTKNLRTSSLIHQTINVYVVHGGVGTGIDFSWLTDRDHIVSIDELHRSLKGDVFSVKELQDFVISEKWKNLQKGYERSIESLLTLSLGAVGVLSLGVGITLGKNLAFPLIGIVFGFIGGIACILDARKHLILFTHSISNEHNLLSKKCDIRKLDKACLEKDDQMVLVNELNYSISTLMAAASDAIESAKVDEAILKMNEVLDELIQMSPGESDDGEIPESGLRKVLGLFQSLGIDTSDFTIQHAYIAFTGHRETRLNIEEATQHLAILNNALYTAGIIRPETKDKIDDRMNVRDAYQLYKKGFENIPDVTREEVEQESRDFDEIISEIRDESIDEEKSVVESEIKTEKPKSAEDDHASYDAEECAPTKSAILEVSHDVPTEIAPEQEEDNITSTSDAEENPPSNTDTKQELHTAREVVNKRRSSAYQRILLDDEEVEPTEA